MKSAIISGLTGKAVVRRAPHQVLKTHGVARVREGSDSRRVRHEIPRFAGFKRPAAVDRHGAAGEQTVDLVAGTLGVYGRGLEQAAGLVQPARDHERNATRHGERRRRRRRAGRRRRRGPSPRAAKSAGHRPRRARNRQPASRGASLRQFRRGSRVRRRRDCGCGGSGIELPAILQAGRWKTTVMVNRYGERAVAGASERRSAARPAAAPRIAWRLLGDPDLAAERRIAAGDPTSTTEAVPRKRGFRGSYREQKKCARAPRCNSLF